MPVQLHVVAGDHTHKLVDLIEGQKYVIGRNPDVDLSFEADSQMSGNHLQISCSGETVLIEDLGSTNGTFVRDNLVTSSTLANEDTFRCGITEFVIKAAETTSPEPPASAQTVVPAAAGAAPAAEAPKPAAPVFVGVSLQVEGFIEETAPLVVERFQLNDAFPISPNPDETPESFANRLIETGEPNHCVTFMAYALPKRAAVWWLTQCIEEVESLHGEEDGKLLKHVQEWVIDPTDELRRNGMQQAEALEMSTPTSWAAVGAFWSGGSMGPAENPPVEPKDELLGKAISGGAILASVFQKPEMAFEKQKVFTEIGLKIASGELSL
ncbi:FHA domain protein [Thalassoglobus neptunius]|uniref:FHA domain protein n=1 Tax=Thalassoglobus neptunius TaxID=1938619 RepID=A0A5C5WBD1_9PLAN|nr:FHA domain-containing protein [Thalassoglobus neptunius]TWT48216.1 FHA domain protein [Thalassoglobus neptunius]